MSYGSVGMDSGTNLGMELLKQALRILNIEVWNAFMAPASMPTEHKTRLSQALQKIMTSPEISEKMQMQGWHVGDVGPQALNARIAADRAAYKAIITQSGMKLE